MNHRAAIVSLFALSCAASNQPPAASPAPRPCAQEAMTPPSNNATLGEDPTKTDPDKYQAVMENDRVRVLRYHDEPFLRVVSRYVLHRQWQILLFDFLLS